MTIPKSIISNLLDSSGKDEKKSILSQLTHNKDKKTINSIISLFDDNDIKIRGEVFSILCLNENHISEILINSLSSESKNIRAFCSLVLANRNDMNGINYIIKLTNDSSSMVRSCALGALGHLRASKARNEIHQGIFDSDLEVKKSAAYALSLINEKLSHDEKIELEKQDDPDFEKILKML
ncbi:MAG: HEAT repeat domain-containing protein [Candidatus Nitrosopelagicus sp.]|jgi:HEAT repeat protein|nr:HEAT repeat domain-containing protein [Candidatus Nitrosopelagicus sp.]